MEKINQSDSKLTVIGDRQLVNQIGLLQLTQGPCSECCYKPLMCSSRD